MQQEDGVRKKLWCGRVSETGRKTPQSNDFRNKAKKENKGGRKLIINTIEMKWITDDERERASKQRKNIRWNCAGLRYLCFSHCTILPWSNTIWQVFYSYWFFSMIEKKTKSISRFLLSFEVLFNSLGWSNSRTLFNLSFGAPWQAVFRYPSTKTTISMRILVFLTNSRYWMLSRLPSVFIQTAHSPFYTVSFPSGAWIFCLLSRSNTLTPWLHAVSLCFFRFCFAIASSFFSRHPIEPIRSSYSLRCSVHCVGVFSPA